MKNPLSIHNPREQMVSAAKIHILLCGFTFLVISSHVAAVTPQSLCNTVQGSLSPCLDYVQGNSSVPSSPCCNQLKRVVVRQPQCLCQVVNGGGSLLSQLGLYINLTLAKQLPTACNLHTPDISACKGTQINNHIVELIAGVVAAGVVFLVSATIIVWFFVFHKRGTNKARQEKEENPHQTNNRNCDRKNVSGVSLWALLVCFVISCKRGNKAPQDEEHLRRTKMEDNDDNDMKIRHVDELAKKCGPRNFSYREIVHMTGNFPLKSTIGRGGFGVVYKGVFESSNLSVDVAVKKIIGGFDEGLHEYVAEMEIISQVRHRNLVQLIGWCHENKALFLVYELMPNGSLDHHLFARTSLLSWGCRYKIAKDLASALSYLHDSCNMCILHRDVKSSNVLLDSRFNAKLGDFGLARLVDHERGWHRTRNIAGTKGYMAPEYQNTGIASKETDVYSFGIVALEIATGKRVTFVDQTGSLVELVEWVWNLYGEGKHLHAADPKLCSAFDVREMECLLVLGLWCAYPLDAHRPSIGKVIGVLNFEMELPTLPLQMPVLPGASTVHPVTRLCSLFSHGSSNTGNSLPTRSSGYSSDDIIQLPPILRLNFKGVSSN